MLAVLVFFPSTGWADSWRQAGTARILTEYDSNPAMTPEYHKGIWRSLFEPGYKLRRTGGASELNAGIALQIVRSSNQTLSQNREDPSMLLDWKRQNNSGEIGLSAKYDQVETRIAESDSTGLAFTDSTRTSRVLSARWNDAMSARSTLALDGAYNDVSYQGGAFVDYIARSSSMMVSYALSERNTSFFKMSYADSIPTGNNPPSRFASAIFGWNWKASDYLEGFLQAGKTKISDANFGKQGAAEVKYRGQRTELALNADRQITPSGLGGFATADQAKVAGGYDVSERNKIGIDFIWRKNRSITDTINRTAGIWLQQDIHSFLGVRTNFLHKTSTGNGIGVGAASSNILSLSLIYTHTDF